MISHLDVTSKKAGCVLCSIVKLQGHPLRLIRVQEGLIPQQPLCLLRKEDKGTQHQVLKTKQGTDQM